METATLTPALKVCYPPDLPVSWARELAADLRKITSHLANVASKLDSTEGTAGRLIADPSVVEAINDILVGVNESKTLRWLVRDRQKAGIQKQYEDAQKTAAPTPAP